MSCLDVMYQVYGPPQPYFAATYSPYHQKLAFYSKMQEAPESASSVSSGSSFSSQAPASIKEEDCGPDKERPPEAEYLSSRCVLLTYFQGDISSVVDEHFSRALSQPSSYSPSSASLKASRSSSAWRDASGYPMSQRSFPPSFWNSTYQPSGPSASLGSPLTGPHPELPFGSDPYSAAAAASLHSHLHQGPPEPWHHPAHHHHHHQPYSLSSQSAAYTRPSAMHEVYGGHFDPRYSSLLVPTSVRPHRLPPPPGTPQCDLGKGEPSAWTTPGPFPGPAGDMSLNVDAARRYSFCGGPLLS